MLLEINSPNPVPLEGYVEKNFENNFGNILGSMPLPSSLILTTISRSFLIGPLVLDLFSASIVIEPSFPLFGKF